MSDYPSPSQFTSAAEFSRYLDAAGIDIPFEVEVETGSVGAILCRDHVVVVALGEPMPEANVECRTVGFSQFDPCLNVWLIKVVVERRLIDEAFMEYKPRRVLRVLKQVVTDTSGLGPCFRYDITGGSLEDIFGPWPDRHESQDCDV